MWMPRRSITSAAASVNVPASPIAVQPSMRMAVLAARLLCPGAGTDVHSRCLQVPASGQAVDWVSASPVAFQPEVSDAVRAAGPNRGCQGVLLGLQVQAGHL